MIKTPKEYREMEHKNLLVEIAKLFKPETYMEIGVKKCYTFNSILPYVKKAVAVDIVNREKYIDYSTSVKIIKCWLPSYDFSKIWKGDIDLLFIDGNHHKESVLNDFYNFLPFVKKETGLIFLHDTYPIKRELIVDGYCSNAWEAAKEIRQEFSQVELEIITLPGPWAGLSMIRPLDKNKHGWMDK